MNSSNITRINLLRHYYIDDAAGYSLNAVYMIISVWCIGANCFLLAVIVKKEALRTSANVFVVNIATSEICVGLSHIVTRPFNVLTNVTVRVAGNACLFSTACTIFSQMASVHALLNATAERYVKICHPFHYSRILTTPVIVSAVSISWINSVLLCCVIIGAEWDPGMKCSLSSLVNKIGYMVGTPYVLVLFLLLFYCNIRIFSTVLRHRRQIRELDQINSSRDAQNIRRAKIIGLVVLFTFLGYVPFVMHAIIGMYVDDTSRVYQILESFTGVLTCINNIANPIIFGWKDKNIRQFTRKPFARE